MPNIAPFLWFDAQAEEAMRFYVDVFNGKPGSAPSSRIVEITYYPEDSEEEHLKGMNGKVLTDVFELDGTRVMCLDGGPLFTFNESISLYVDCDSQEAIDYLWNRLSAVPEAEACGWLKDKYGVSWQIVPKQMAELMNRPDPEKRKAVTHALMQMKKIVIAELKDAGK
jgi:predicted 3-demethylubiquinone-9 3-methyltransferase (glyoxalase superfamily)